MPQIIYDRLSDSTPSPPQTLHAVSRRTKDPNGPSLVEAFGGIAKKRAAKACICCRRRKVRCDVSDFGAPCSNCRFDKVVCTVKESRRNRRQSNGEYEAANSALRLIGGPRDQRRVKSTKRSNDLDGVNLEEASTPGFHEPDHEQFHVPHLIYQMQGMRAKFPRTKVVHKSPQIYRPPIDKVHKIAPGGYVKGLFPPTIEIQPPKVNTLSLMFRPLPSRIAAEDLEYLWAKGALSIPEPDLRNELLKSYIEHVHCHMPIIDLHEVIEVIERGDGSTGQISLLLYQCIMFAGSAFIGLEHLKAIGFATRFEARKAFFTKIRVLYDLDYENDRIALVQSLLLMTHWYEEPDDQKDLWYWTGVAASLSLQIGLHRPCTDPRISEPLRKLYKRIGWACFARDQLVAIGTQRPTRIKSQDHTLPILTLSDFDLSPVPESKKCVLTSCIVARDVMQLQSLAITCIELSKLMLCLGRVVDTQYAMVKNDPGGVTSGAIKLLLPKSSGPESDEVLICDAGTKNWRQNCAPEAKYSGIAAGEALIGQEPINGHKALLEMIYHVSIIMLHRPLATSNDPSISSSARSLSATKVKDAAFAITTTAQDLLSRGLIPFMPSHGPTVLLQAIMVHLAAAARTNGEGTAANIEGFTTCMNAMHVMRDVHNGADVIIRLIELGMKQRGALNAPKFPRSPSLNESQPQRESLSPGSSSSVVGSSSNKNASTGQSPGAEKQRRGSSSPESITPPTPTELQAILGARMYTPPVNRRMSSHEIAPPDPRLLYESSGLLVDEKLFGGWNVAKGILQNMLGLADGEVVLEMADEDDEDDDETVAPANTMEKNIPGGETAELQEVNDVVAITHPDFMEYVDSMVELEFGSQAQDFGMTDDQMQIQADMGQENGVLGDRMDLEGDSDLDLDLTIEVDLGTGLEMEEAPTPEALEEQLLGTDGIKIEVGQGGQGGQQADQDADMVRTTDEEFDETYRNIEELTREFPL